MKDQLHVVTLNTPMPVRPHYSDVFADDGKQCPVCCELAADAWERMTTAGVHIDIDESTAGRPVDPRGHERFRTPPPPGGFRCYRVSP